jgi:protein-tyrosine phosphatase
MSTIIPNKLYLGNILNVNRLDWLNRNNIQTIICVASKDDVTIKPEIKEAKIVYQFEILDQEDQTIEFDTIVQLIEDSMKGDGAVLVNCAVGISRSPTAVIAYLMKTRRMTLDGAYRFVKRARSKIDPNMGFIAQLREYEASLFSGIYLSPTI